jgi:hypothetical protein
MGSFRVHDGHEKDGVYERSIGRTACRVRTVGSHSHGLCERFVCVRVFRAHWAGIERNVAMTDQKPTQVMHLGRKRKPNMTELKKAKVQAQFVQRAKNIRDLFDYETIAEEFFPAASCNADLRIVSIKFN